MFPVPLQDVLGATATEPSARALPPRHTNLLPRRQRQAAVGGHRTPVLGREGATAAGTSRGRLVWQLQTISSEFPKHWSVLYHLQLQEDELQRASASNLSPSQGKLKANCSSLPFH